MDCIENDACANSVVASVFVEPLLRNDMEGFMKYAVEMGSGAKICISCFIKIG
jgi:hypothetical protein